MSRGHALARKVPLGGRLTITVEAGGHIYYEDLVGS
jgi:hypothetical protein